jgi:tryptophanyl-tRNA synthetase
MSKSDHNPKSYIALSDTPEEIRGKIRRAVTDSGETIRCRDDKPGLCNLLEIFSTVTGGGLEELENSYEGKGYSVLKEDLSDASIAFISPIQGRYFELVSDKCAINKIFQSGKIRAKKRAESTMRNVRKSLEMIPPDPELDCSRN